MVCLKEIRAASVLQPANRDQKGRGFVWVKFNYHLGQLMGLLHSVYVTDTLTGSSAITAPQINARINSFLLNQSISSSVSVMLKFGNINFIFPPRYSRNVSANHSLPHTKVRANSIHSGSALVLLGPQHKSHGSTVHQVIQNLQLLSLQFKIQLSSS